MMGAIAWLENRLDVWRRRRETIAHIMRAAVVKPTKKHATATPAKVPSDTVAFDDERPRLAWTVPDEAGAAAISEAEAGPDTDLSEEDFDIELVTVEVMMEGSVLEVAQ